MVDSNTEKVSAFEAKTRLSELLRETERGMSFRILRRGKEVARLIPPSKEDKKQDLKQVLASFQEIRGRVPGKIKIRELMPPLLLLGPFRMKHPFRRTDF